MLRHFLNATARTSSSWLFAKPNAPAYVSSSRSLFSKPNQSFSGGLNFFSSTARTSSRSLIAKPNTPVFTSSLHSLSDQKLCASEKYSESGRTEQLKRAALRSISFVCNTILLCLLYFGFMTFLISNVTAHDFRFFSLDELNEKKPLDNVVYLREYVQANAQYKEIKGSGMPQHTFFWRKAIVAHEMMSDLNEMLVDCKREGIRIEESENYCFVITTSQSEKARIAERIAKLRDIRWSIYKPKRPSVHAALMGEGYGSEERSWSVSDVYYSSNSPGATKPRHTDQSCYMAS